MLRLACRILNLDIDLYVLSRESNSEAELLGIRPEFMATTSVLLNTADEARAIRQMLPSSKTRVLLVTSAYHMRRSIKLFDRQAIEVFHFRLISSLVAVGLVLSGVILPNGFLMLLLSIAALVLYGNFLLAYFISHGNPLLSA